MSALDYTQISKPGQAQLAQEITDNLKSNIKALAFVAIEIGRDLIQMKEEVLQHGQFGPWLEAEFEMTIRTAQRYMRIARRFGDKYDQLSHLNLSIQVLDLLSSPSIDDETAETALAIARENGGLTFTDAQSLLQQYPDEPNNSPYIILDPREDTGGYNVLRVPRSDDMPDSAYIVYDEDDDFPDNPEDYEEYESALPISRVTLERSITTQETQRFVAEFDPRPKQLPLPLHLQNPIRIDPLMVYHKPHYIEQALDKLHELYRLATGRSYSPKEPTY
jgi:hypothetical protein